MFRNSRVITAAALAMLLCASVAADQKKKEKTPPVPKIKVGSVAPDFKMLDQAGKEVSLSEFRGKKNVVLAFIVFAFTGG
jgi:cytochrome oxidase Cu insertion factor (SCO1/SenC/PrrC family)